MWIYLKPTATFRQLTAWQNPFNISLSTIFSLAAPALTPPWQFYFSVLIFSVPNLYYLYFALSLSFYELHHNLMLSRSVVTLPNSCYWNMPKSTSTVPVDSVLHFFILLQCLPNLSWPSQSLYPMFLLWHVRFSWLCALFRMQSWRLHTYLSPHIYRDCISEETLIKWWQTCFFVFAPDVAVWHFPEQKSM